MKSRLSRIWSRSIENLIVPLLPRRYANLMQCSKHQLWNPYFVDAEPKMEKEWEDFIWPAIRDFDFETVLELAPGGGRNTEKLCAVAKKIHAVDYNAYAIDQTRERLGSSHNGCALEYHINNGTDLHMIGTGTISAIYSWDAAVHFDSAILESYIPEFARVLRAGGRGFVHHSNLGEGANKNIKKNPGWRSNMSKQRFADICRASGLEVIAQVDIPWSHTVDCGTVFARPA